VAPTRNERVRPLSLALLLALTGCAHTPAQQSASLLQRLGGHWTGTLEYVDYQPPHGHVRLPTQLTGTFADGALQLEFVFDDGPGKTVVSRESLRVDGSTVRWGDEKREQVFSVVEATADRLLLEVEGADDDAPATLREQFELTAGHLRLVKTVRARAAGPGAPFVFRHGYDFTLTAR